MNMHTYVDHQGIWRCSCGTIRDFAETIVNHICPFIDSIITCIFNDKMFTVTKTDTVELIISRWNDVSYNNYEHRLVERLVVK